MFGPVQPTPYDFAFSVFGIPVRVLPTFWLMSVLFGFDYVNQPDGVQLLLAWVAVVFVSILVHELGHALIAYAFGYPPRILLYHFGGLAMYEPHRDYTTAKAVLISLAGPGAGFLLFGVTIAVMFALAAGGAPPTEFLGKVLMMIVSVNLFWGFINLLPVLPLDGGQVCREVCLALNPRSGLTWALWISIVAGALVGGLALMMRMIYLGIMFLLLAFQSYQELQQRRYW